MSSGVIKKNERSKGFSSQGGFGRDSGAEKVQESTWPAVVKSLCYGFAVAVILILITSIFATFYDIPDRAINYIITAISIICSFMVGLRSAKLNKKNGLMIGIIAGVIYAIIIFLIGWLGFKTVGFSPAVIANIAISGAVSGLGGVVGINGVSKKKVKRSR